MTTAMQSSSGKGYIPTLNPAAQASIDKGRQERAAKAATQQGAQPAAATTATAATSTTQNASGAKSTSTPATSAPAQSSAVVNISSAARARLEAEKSVMQTPTPPQGATSTKPAATANPASNTGRPEPVKFSSIDDAIAYGTKRANEQAAARNSKVLRA